MGYDEYAGPKRLWTGGSDGIGASTWLPRAIVGMRCRGSVHGRRCSSRRTLGAVNRALAQGPRGFSHAAVISNVEVSNALRAEFSQNGPPNIAEFGTVKERDGFEALREMDALHAVRDGILYPAVLLTTGLKDPRVEPWQVAKMTARLQKATASKNPVLLRVTFDAGHGLGSTRTQADEQRADEYAFVLWHTGVPGFQPTLWLH